MLMNVHGHLLPVFPVQDYLQSTMWLFWLSPGLMIAVWSVIVVSDKARQVWPYNMLLLGALTVVLGFMVGTVSTIYSVQFVLLAMAVTSGGCYQKTVVCCTVHNTRQPL